LGAWNYRDGAFRLDRKRPALYAALNVTLNA
jgi:hypothetical protein